MTVEEIEAMATSVTESRVWAGGKALDPPVELYHTRLGEVVGVIELPGSVMPRPGQVLAEWQGQFMWVLLQYLVLPENSASKPAEKKGAE